MNKKCQMEASRFIALILFIFIFSCTANKKVVDDDFATDSASEESISSTEDPVSEDDLFAENSMSNAGSEASTESEKPAETTEEPVQNQAAADEFSDFEEPPAQQDPVVAQNQTEAPKEESLNDLNLDSEPTQQTAENPADMSPSPESLTDEQKAQAAAEPPAPVVETPTPEIATVEAPPEVVVTTPEPVPEASTAETSVSVPTGEMARIREVQFRGNENGGALIIKANRELAFTTRLNSSTNQLVLEVQNATVPKKLMRPLITKDMSSSIGTIDIYQRPNSSVARFVIQLRADSPEPLIQPEGDTLLVIGTPMFMAGQPPMGSAEKNASMGQSQIAPSPLLQSSNQDTTQSSDVVQIPTPVVDSITPQLNQQLSQSVIPLQTNGNPVELGTQGYDAKSTKANYDLYTKGLLSSRDLQDFLTNNNRYYGKKISIVTQDLEVRDVLNFLSEEASVNLIYDDDIAGKVSIKLRRVPWDQALVTLLKSKKLGYQRQGSILRIARLETLLKEEDEAVKIRDARIDQEPLVVRNFRINYADISQLETKIKDFIAETKKDAVNRGRVSSDARTNTIIVTETPTKLKQVEELIQALDTQPQQVQIEARIIEASETFSKNIGVRWGLNNGKVGDTEIPTPFDRGRVATGLDKSELSAMPSMSMTPSVGASAGAFNTNLWFGRIGAFGDLELNLNLGQVENKIKVLSSPRIVVLSGTTATVDQRIKINVPDEQTSVTTTTGGSTSQTKFKQVEAGVNLNVSPQISNIDTVRLKLNLTKSVIEDASKGDTSSRNAQSEIILKSMQTAVIGGIFESQQNENRSGVPGLQDLPVLGGLFRGKLEVNRKSELMIFLTPKILPPLSIPADTIGVMPSMNTPAAPVPAMDQSMNSIVEPPLSEGPPTTAPPTIAPADTTEDELQLE